MSPRRSSTRGLVVGGGPASEPGPAGQRLLLVVIDGLGAEQLRRAIDEGHAPVIASLMEASGASVLDATSPFPSLTPVCLSSIVTGAGPDRHRVPSLGWYSRGRGRFVEYGSSFAAATVEGTRVQIEDSIVNLNHVHLAEDPRTLFEHVQDAGREAASINYLVWRGRTRHTIRHDYGPVRAAAKHTRVHAVYGPDHMYFGELFGSTRPILPQVGVKRPRDWGGGHIARWLLRQTDAAFLLLYLGQHDVASHNRGPDETQRAIRRADRALARAIGAYGSIDQLLAETAVVVCADHGQVAVDHHAQLEEVFDDVELFRGAREVRSGAARRKLPRGPAAEDCDLAVIGSNRVAMAYRTRQSHHATTGVGTVHGPTDRWIAERACESPGSDLAAWRDAGDGELHVITRDGAHVRARHDPAHGVPTARAARLRDSADRWHLEGDVERLGITVDDGTIEYGDYPDALHRLDAALRCINTGDVMVSAEPGWEFTDIGGSAHEGGSHGSLHRCDSVAPLMVAGARGGAAPPDEHARLTDIAPMVLAHLGIGTGAGAARL